MSQKFTADSSGYSAAIAAMIRDNQGLIKSVGDVQRKIKELGADLGALPDRRIKVEIAGVDDAIAKAGDLKAALDGLHGKSVRVDVDTGGALAQIAKVKAAMAGLGHAHAGIPGVAGGGAAASALTAVLRDQADAADAAARAIRRQASAVRRLDKDIKVLQATTGSGGGGLLGGGPVAGGGGGWAAAAASASAGGGGGGSGGGGGGSFVPWRGGGFQAVKFWGMAIAEFAATAVPALVAAGSAAAVGMQGAQDVLIRAKAIGAASQSIGPAFGQSTSSYLGLPGYLSQAQDAARGGVYELAGAGINFARAGSGQFSQMGVNTIAMIDRGTANMLINYKNRQAAGKGAGGLLGGGTDWLRRYGDLFSNLGNTAMNLAPYEPGLGGDVLNTLVGGTGLLKQATQDIPGPILGAIMAGEGGMRWGKAALSGKGLLGRVLGLGKVGGIGGLLSKGGEGLFARGMGGALGGVGLGMMGAGDALATFGGPISLAAALSAYGMSYLASTMPTDAQRRVAGLQAGIGKAGFSAAFQPLAHAIVTTKGLASQSRGGSLLSQEQQVQTPYEIGRFGPGITPTYAQTYAAAAQGFGQTMTDLIGAGPQLVTALKKAGLKSVSMGDAFQIAQNALLDLPHAFGKDGKLNKTSVQMLSNYVSGIAPMTRSGGGFNAAIEAQQIMSSPAMKSLSQVNQAMDSMTQIMSGGPAGMATLFGMLGGTPVTTKHGGLKLAASPAMAKMAQALTSFTTPGGAAAWNTFAGPQGFVAAEQQNLDQLRTAMTLSAIGQPGAAGLAGFQIQQMLPMAKKSPAALAMLMQQGQQMGIGGYYDPSKSQGQNYAAEVKSLASVADNAGKANRQMNNMTVSLSRLPVLARQFSQNFNADVMSKQVAAAATSFSKITAAARSGKLDTGAIGGLTGQLKAAFGGNMGAVRAQIQQALSTSGLSAGMQRKIMLQVDANVGPAQAKINGIHGKQITISATPTGLSGVQAAINAIHGKTVTITINTINRIITQAIGALGTPGGVAPMTLAGGPAGMRITSHAAGYRVPGYGGGDIFPAMLEPGEAVVPKHLTPLLAPFLGAHRVPGFAAGGVAGSSVLGFASMMTEALNGPQVRESLRSVIDGLIAADLPRSAGWLTAQNPRTPLASGKMGGGGTGTPPIGGGGFIVHPQSPHGRQAGSHLSVEILKGITDGIKNAKPEAAAAAKAMVAKIGQEIAYAKQTSANMTAGLNFGGMDTTQGPVQTQMKSYADSLKTFSGDIKSMSKGGLNKDLLRQMIGAGPVQGDALAQSIQQGPGGIKAVNQLYASIQKMSRGIGAQAAGAIFGGTLAPNLKSGTFVNNNVSISVNLSGGKGGGDLQLTNAQINQLVSLIQKKLLQQAKRNPKTGLKLPGKGA